jgi:hypothetical protein
MGETGTVKQERTMTGQNKPAIVALRARRDAVVDALSTQFTADGLDLDEFEERIDLAHRATSIAELDELLADLFPDVGEAASTSLVAQPSDHGNPPAKTGQWTNRVRSVMSSVQRKGTWRVPDKLRVLAVMGEVILDFREAELDPGVTDVRVTSVMGEIKIIVPPDLRVECDGASVVGQFESLEVGTGEPSPSEPMLRINGRAILGAVTISTSPSSPTPKLTSGTNAKQIGQG